MLISIFCRAHNNQDTIGRAIQSVLAQSYQNWELIIYNDASSDNSDGIIKSFLSDSRIKYIKGELNIGPGWALKACESAAGGQAIGVLDGDDWLEPTCLAETAYLLQYYQVVYTNWYAEQWTPFDKEGLLANYCCGFHFTLIAKELFDNIGGFRPELAPAEDYDLALRLSEHCTFYYHPRKLYNYQPGALSLIQAQQQRAKSLVAIEEAIERRGLNYKIQNDYLIKE